MTTIGTHIAAILGGFIFTASLAHAADPVPAIASEAPSPNDTTAPMSKGEYLARAGDCVACHSVPGGAAFSGGLKMGTPLGSIYSTNITPDKEFGIGDYTLTDFENALRRGIAKDGHRLYRRCPIPHTRSSPTRM
ncbi:hypothetical protein [Bradyrhizobium elkanii]|uniref:hypothetical protein n=1 Tax=Bradyrhizobium elkanii TaxID=29448 RepID=UPI001930DD73|nr:hypothetical protein [Bradyrhizobium elkanii]